ncbi:MAG TPA: biliverdin-producing heme oxygenase [Kofleriaceae bacterium]|jgi:heme oxygenase|nr:biliverdin-producing heme oxygenase [Kofleriaceae bacterium]
MLVRLGLETTQHHAPADEDRLAALSYSSIDEYRAFLLRVFGFEAPIEEAIGMLRQLEVRFVRDRARSPLLKSDLLALGLSESQLAEAPRSSAISIRTVADALGWMFVLERQTLLAGLVRRQLQQKLGASIPVEYLGAYGETPGARLRELGTRLGNLAHVHTPAAIVDAAHTAFRAQRQWYRHKEPARPEVLEPKARAIA